MSLFVLLSVMLVLIFTVTTTTGAKYSLGLLQHFSGIHIQGVSGNFIRKLTIQHIELRHDNVDLTADNVALQWQPKALLQRQLKLNYVRFQSVQLIVGSSQKQSKELAVSLPTSLKLPSPLKLLVADQLMVDRLQLTLRGENSRPEKPQQFSALQAHLVIDSARYQLQFSGTTPWGSAVFYGGFETSTPFNTQAQFDWQGLPNKQNGVTVPATTVHGSLSGSWEKLLVQAQINLVADSNLKQPYQKNNFGSGHIYTVLTPFKSLPIETLQVDLDAVNPATFYHDAPKAHIQLKAYFKLTEGQESPTLSGQFLLKNSVPMTWNSGGVPISTLRSEVALKQGQLSWKRAQVELKDGGLVKGSGYLNWVKKEGLALPLATGEVARLPDISASAELENVNLLDIDSRLKKTQLNGKIQAENVKTGWQFLLNLNDAYSKNLDANLAADLYLNHAQIVTVKKLQLRAKETTLTAQGDFALRNKREFTLQGEAHSLNPARWLDVPEGRIATRFNVTGQLNQGWRVNAQVDHLSGQFAGLSLQGESDVVAQQDKSIAIKKAEFHWGKNHLSAKGSWQLNASPGSQQEDQLQFSAALPDLSELSDPFKKIMPKTLNDKFKGSLFIDGVLSGNAKQPGGQLSVKADQLAIPGLVELEKLQASFLLAGGSQGKMVGNVDATGLIVSGNSSEDNGFVMTQLQGNLSGLRHAHELNVNAVLPRKYHVALRAKGDLQEPRSAEAGNVVQWQGEVQQVDLSGPSDLQLTSPFTLLMSGKTIQMSPANWQGKLGKLQIQQLDWSRGQVKTKGQLQGLPVVRALKLWRSKLPLYGDLHVDAGWEFIIGQQAAGQFEIKRTSGDLTVQDVSSGYSQTFALGLQNLLMKGHVGQVNSQISSGLQQPVEMRLQVQGTQLGLVDGQFSSYINKTVQGWGMSANAPLSGTAKLQINDIQWLSAALGSGVSLRGVMQAQAQLGGTIAHPTYSAQITGNELQVALTELGVLLPNGVLNASLESNPSISSGNTQFKLNKLRFSQTINVPKRYQDIRNQLTDLAQLTGLSETGFVEASGSIDLKTGLGSIATHWQRFPFLQNADNWLVASGEALLTEMSNAWNLTGQLIADAAYFSVPKQAPPKLSNDVIVLKKNAKRDADKEISLQSSVDFTIKTGNNFVFVGRGLATRLMGDIRVRLQNAGPILATGSIQTVGGAYEGYGQQLAIERGILNFQGPLDNPTLNVRALRRGLQVEAGVDVVGTVAKPEVRLVSEPNVPDQDKLSWLVLGRSSDQTSGSDAGLLLTAANAIWGGDNGSNIPRKIAQTLGLDDISLSTTSSSPESQLPDQTVAGSISSSAAPDQVFSVGKNITPDLVFSIERSLTNATNGIKLTWKLTRRFSIIGRAGSDTSIDGQYLFSFD